MHMTTIPAALRLNIMPYMEIFGGGKFWRTMHVKAIGEEKYGE